MHRWTACSTVSTQMQKYVMLCVSENSEFTDGVWPQKGPGSATFSEGNLDVRTNIVQNHIAPYDPIEFLTLNWNMWLVFDETSY